MEFSDEAGSSPVFHINFSLLAGEFARVKS